MKTEVKVSFNKSPDYRLLPVTGAWGGPSLTSEIVVDFYVDKGAMPDNITLVIDSLGPVEEKERSDSDHQTVREVLVGLVMRPDIALVIGNFLVEKANLVLKKSNAPTN